MTMIGIMILAPFTTRMLLLLFGIAAIDVVIVIVGFGLPFQSFAFRSRETLLIWWLWYFVLLSAAAAAVVLRAGRRCRFGGGSNNNV
jgi:hypothetical protein